MAYKNSNRKVFYLNDNLSLLFDAYVFENHGSIKRKRSGCGILMVRAFFKSMPEEKKKSLIDKYNAHRVEQNKINDDGN